MSAWAKSFPIGPGLIKKYNVILSQVTARDRDPLDRGDDIATVRHDPHPSAGQKNVYIVRLFKARRNSRRLNCLFIVCFGCFGRTNEKLTVDWNISSRKSPKNTTKQTVFPKSRQCWNDGRSFSITVFLYSSGCLSISKQLFQLICIRFYSGISDFLTMSNNLQELKYTIKFAEKRITTF